MFRPIGLISATAVRIRIPPLVVSITSSASVTLAIATTGPLRSVTLMSISPLPPRFCERYSVKGVRLPKPLAQTVRRLAGSSSPLATTIPTTSSPSSRSIPRTPKAGRPIERTFDSSKRIDIPSLVERITWSLALVRATPISSSPSSSPRAMIPRPSGRLKAGRSVFLTVPRRVTMNRHSSSLNLRTGTRPVIFSPRPAGAG